MQGQAGAVLGTEASDCVCSGWTAGSVGFGYVVNQRVCKWGGVCWSGYSRCVRACVCC